MSADHILTAVAWPYANGPRHIGHVAGFGRRRVLPPAVDTLSEHVHQEDVSLRLHAVRRAERSDERYSDPNELDGVDPHRATVGQRRLPVGCLARSTVAAGTGMP